jgi:uncharacterized membrane protein YraQ (UPF0718 family)/copper chaperone CopZ
MDEIIKFSVSFLDLFLEMSLYLMIGLAFVGLLFVFFSKEQIAKNLGSDNWISILKAAILGVPLPLCSCGVIPSSVFLAKNGASRGAVISFLTSTPQTGVDSIIATYGMMGPIFAIYRPLAALAMGLVSGSIVQYFPGISRGQEMDDLYSASDSCDLDLAQKDIKKDSFAVKIKKALKYAFVDFLDDISPQFIFGLFIAALISYFVPASYFENTPFSSGILGMLVMIAIGAPMYICATASIPIALSLMAKGFTPGVAFVFLAVGPATNAASLAILSKTLGKKVVSVYLISLSVSAIIFGYILDWYFSISGAKPLLSDIASGCCSVTEIPIQNYIFGTIFLILLLSSLYRLYLKKHIIKEKKMGSEKIISIQGMSCNHCADAVKKAAESVIGVESAYVDLSRGKLIVSGQFEMDHIVEAVDKSGYKASEDSSEGACCSGGCGCR